MRMDTEVAGTDWTNEENDILVADYFAMLGEELAGRASVKAHHRRAVVEQIGLMRRQIVGQT